MGDGKLNLSGITYDLDNACAYCPNSEPWFFTKEKSTTQKSIVHNMAEEKRLAALPKSSVTDEQRELFAKVVSKILSSPKIGMKEKRKVELLIKK